MPDRSWTLNLVQYSIAWFGLELFGLVLKDLQDFKCKETWGCGGSSGGWTFQ